MNISLTHDTAALAMTADGSGNAVANFVLGDYTGFSLTWALTSTGAPGVPAITIKATNKPGGLVADAHTLTSGVTMSTAYAVDPKNLFVSYFISVTGMTANTDTLTAYLRRWR